MLIIFSLPQTGPGPRPAFGSPGIRWYRVLSTFLTSLLLTVSSAQGHQAGGALLSRCAPPAHSSKEGSEMWPLQHLPLAPSQTEANLVSPKYSVDPHNNIPACLPSCSPSPSTFMLTHRELSSSPQILQWLPEPLR